MLFPEDIARYKGVYDEGWHTIRQERFEKMLELGIIDPQWGLSPQDPHVPDWNGLSGEQKETWSLKMQVYAAMVDRMDQGIGHVLKALRESGKAKNTLVVFLSDNGGCHVIIQPNPNYFPNRGPVGSRESFDAYEYPWANVSNTPFRLFKQYTHEGGISTPFIAYWPGVIKGGRVDRQPAHIIDIMPTFTEIAGGIYPDSVNGYPIHPSEGLSLLDLFKGKVWRGHDWLIWEHQGSRALYRNGWKLVSSRDDYVWELYRLDKDRDELHNMAKKEPEVLNEMIAFYHKQAKRLGIRDWRELTKK